MGAIMSYFKRSLFQKPSKVCIIGLDGAGKTTILYCMKLGEKINTSPTVGYNLEELTFNKTTMVVHDLGGQDKIRKLWSRHYKGVKGVIFVIDSADQDRFLSAVSAPLARPESSPSLPSVSPANSSALTPIVESPNKEPDLHDLTRSVETNSTGNNTAEIQDPQSRNNISATHSNETQPQLVESVGQLPSNSSVKSEFETIMKNKTLKNAVIMILANKQDLPNAASTSELSEMLELPKYKKQRKNPMAIFPTSACHHGQNLLTAFLWFSKKIDKT